MKAILEFNVEEEKENFYNCLNGREYYECIIEILSHLRQTVKYSENESLQDAAEQIRDEVIKIIEEHHIAQHIWN